ncbi:hypothetical protein PSPO01_07763 [Paraphaeosphaeria sporulosa]
MLTPRVSWLWEHFSLSSELCVGNTVLVPGRRPQPSLLLCDHDVLIVTPHIYVFSVIIRENIDPEWTKEIMSGTLDRKHCEMKFSTTTALLLRHVWLPILP